MLLLGGRGVYGGRGRGADGFNGSIAWYPESEVDGQVPVCVLCMLNRGCGGAAQREDRGIQEGVCENGGGQVVSVCSRMLHARLGRDITFHNCCTVAKIV